MMRNSEALDQLWESQPKVIRSFLALSPSYMKLSEEIAYMLEKNIRSSDIDFASITHRVKALDSFCEKVVRKKYKDPLKEISDIGGVRIVFLYSSDRPKIEAIIEQNLEIVEKVDKVDENDTEHFGYGALHYLVCLGKKSIGARYDELQGLVCEIQVRTILQDAWGIVAHHLSYKQESDVPNELRRGLNALSGLFETADSKFDQLREKRRDYSKRIKEKLAERGFEFLKQNVNLDNLIEYLNWRFPHRRATIREDAMDLLSEITRYGYNHIFQIDIEVLRSYEAVEASEKKYPPRDRYTKKCIYAPVGFVRAALAFTNDKYLNAIRSSEKSRKEFSEFSSLVKPK